MPINIKAAADFWARVFGDTATPGDGSANTSPLRLDQYNSDVGRAQTSVTDDGDISTIDTITKAYTVNPAANTTGAANNRHSSNFLLRWLIQVVQNLRVQGNIAAGVTDSGNPVKAGGKYNATLPALSDTQRGDLQLSSRGELFTSAIDFVGSPITITAADIVSTTTTGQSNQSIITGTPTAGSVASMSPTGDSSFSVKVSGAWVGTLQFERTLDAGMTWTPIGAFAAGTSYTNTQITANGSFHGNCSASNGVRVRCLSLTSGSPVITLLAGAGTGTITIGNPLRLFDAVSGTLFTIKPASTLAASTDTAIVVANRPGGAIENAITLATPTTTQLTFTISSGTALSNYVRLVGRAWKVSCPQMTGATVRIRSKLNDADSTGSIVVDETGNPHDLYVGSTYAGGSTQRPYSGQATAFLSTEIGSLIAFESYSDATTTVNQTAPVTITIKAVV